MAESARTEWYRRNNKNCDPSVSRSKGTPHLTIHIRPEAWYTLRQRFPAQPNTLVASCSFGVPLCSSIFSVVLVVSLFAIYFANERRYALFILEGKELSSFRRFVSIIRCRSSSKWGTVFRQAQANNFVLKLYEPSRKRQHHDISAIRKKKTPRFK